MKILNLKFLVALLLPFVLASCAVIEKKEPVVIVGYHDWSIVTGQYTGSFKFTVLEDGSFEGVSTWSAGSGGLSNKIRGAISNDYQFEMTRFLEGSHVGKTQTFTGTIDRESRTASGIWSGFPGSANWSATIK